MKLSDLKPAKYNPRVISAKQLANLAKSMMQYGDLSGVVLNKKTNTLISGHQRLKTLRDAGVKTTIVTKKVKDKHGTIEEGHIIASTEHGELRLPLRVVNWDDKIAEMAANIAANAHGGDFDSEKLRVLLAKIKPGVKFDVDLLGLDPLTIRTLGPKVDDLPGKKSKSSDDDDDGDVDENGGTFQSFGEDSFEFDHTCPKCKFQYNESDALKAAKKKARAEAEEKPKSKKSKKLDKSSKKLKGDKAGKKVKRPKGDDVAPKKKKKGLAEKLASKKKSKKK